MPLVKSDLKTKLKTHFENMKNETVDDGGEKNADGLATIIDDYIKSATITVPTGSVLVTTAGGSTTQTGASTAPAIATIE